MGRWVTSFAVIRGTPISAMKAGACDETGFRRDRARPSLTAIAEAKIAVRFRVEAVGDHRACVQSATFLATRTIGVLRGIEALLSVVTGAASAAVGPIGEMGPLRAGERGNTDLAIVERIELIRLKASPIDEAGAVNG